LPEGMKRIGYDANNQCYYFLDTLGEVYEGEPGEQYGSMHRIDSQPPTPVRAMFECDPGAPTPRLDRDESDPSNPPRTFSDMIPASSITYSPSPPVRSRSSSSSSTSASAMSPRARFISAARRVQLPRMQHVVKAVMTRGAGASSTGDGVDEKAQLLRTGSVSSSVLSEKSDYGSISEM